MTDFRQIHWPRSKISLTRCREQKAAFLSVGRLTLWSFGLCERSTIILVEMFSEMCCLEDNVSRNCQTNTVARSGLSRSALRSLVARRIHAKQVGNAHFLCLVQVTRIYIAVEETLLGFVLASKRVPRCKEEAVLYKRKVCGPWSASKSH